MNKRLLCPTEGAGQRTGLYRHQDQDLLRIDDKCYGSEQDPVTGEHRLEHPTACRYLSPLLEHNGAGELED